MNFELELKKGNMVISECGDCNKITWPPSEFCNQCLKETSWRKCSNQGKIVEVSKQNDTYFGIVEFERSLRIMGAIVEGYPDVNKTVKVIDCGISNNNYFIKMKVVE